MCHSAAWPYYYFMHSPTRGNMQRKNVRKTYSKTQKGVQYRRTAFDDILPGEKSTGPLFESSGESSGDPSLKPEGEVSAKTNSRSKEMSLGSVEGEEREASDDVVDDMAMIPGASHTRVLDRRSMQDSEDKVWKWMETFESQTSLSGESTRELPGIEKIRQEPTPAEIQEFARHEVSSQILSDGWYTSSGSNEDDKGAADVCKTRAGPKVSAPVTIQPPPSVLPASTQGVEGNTITPVELRGRQWVAHSTPLMSPPPVPAAEGVLDVSPIPCCQEVGDVFSEEITTITEARVIESRSRYTQRPSAPITVGGTGKRIFSRIMQKRNKMRTERPLRETTPVPFETVALPISHKYPKVLDWLETCRPEGLSDDEELQSIERVRKEPQQAGALSGVVDGSAQGLDSDKNSGGFLESCSDFTMESSPPIAMATGEPADGSAMTLTPPQVPWPRPPPRTVVADLWEDSPACSDPAYFGPHVFHSTPRVPMPPVLGIVDISRLSPIPHCRKRQIHVLELSNESTPPREAEMVLPRVEPKRRKLEGEQDRAFQKPVCSTMLFHSQQEQLSQAFPRMSSIHPGFDEGKDFGDFLPTPTTRPGPAAVWGSPSRPGQPSGDHKMRILTSTPTKNPPKFGPMDLQSEISSISSGQDDDDVELAPLRTSSTTVNSMEIACDSFIDREVDIPNILETAEAVQSQEESMQAQEGSMQQTLTRSPPLLVSAGSAASAVPPESPVPVCVVTRLPYIQPRPVKVLQGTVPSHDQDDPSPAPVDAVYRLAQLLKRQELR